MPLLALDSQRSASAATAKTATDAALAPQAKADVKSMDFAAAASHLMPGGAADHKHAPPPTETQAKQKAATGELSPAEVNAAIVYNRSRGFATATIKKIQRVVGTSADGVIGADTVRKVAQFQARNGLGVDGKVGPQTLTRVTAEGGQDQKVPTPNPNAGAQRLTHADALEAIDFNRSKGFSVSQIRKIQAKVGASQDGVLGPDTVQKIAEFQAKQGLEVDGKVGPQTAKAIGVELSAGVPAQGSNAQKLRAAMNRAKALGLTITSTTGGKHTPTSYHYRGRAFDAAGSPKVMAAFFWEIMKTGPTELFHDPCGAYKNGVYSKQGIGGHGRHVHVAY